MSLDLKSLSIPDGWKVSTVGKTCDIHNNLRMPISADERKGIVGEYPYYGPTGILGKINHFRIEGKYALIGEDGDHFLKFSKMPMTLLVEGKFNVNNHAHIISGGKECTTEWFYHFFRHIDISPFISRQGAGRYKLNKAALEKLPILIPPLPEQRKITEILTIWDQAIVQTENLVSALHQRKKGVIQRVFSGQDRFAGFIGEWRKAELGDFFYSFSKKNAANEDLVVLSCSTIHGIVPQTFLFGKRIASKDIRRYKVVERGDLIYDPMLLWDASIGFLEVVDKGVISPAYTTFKFKEDSGNWEYFKYLLKTHYYRQHYKFISQGTNFRRRKAPAEAFLKLEVVLPPTREEQDKIVDVLRICDQEIALTSKKLEALKEQKKGLIQRLLTGHIRVKV